MSGLDRKEKTTLNCSFCQVELTGGTDTFGRIDTPICVTCWLASQDIIRAQLISTLEFDDNGQVIAQGIRIERPGQDSDDAE